MDSDHTHFDYNLSGRSPFIRTLLNHTSDTLKFEGYFYLEEETMPVERLLIHHNEVFHIEILQKLMDDDTSNSESDEEEFYNGDPEDNIVFFPTGIIELKYRVIKRLESMEEINQARDRIQTLDAEVEARNAVFKRQREDREQEEMIEHCKNMDYSGFLPQRSTSGTS
jgi:hypothetical protein